jgi:hypothetical protein
MGPCNLTRLILDPEKIARLSVEQRFTFFLMGHMFNEIMSLQKLVYRTMAQEDEPITAKIEGSVATSTMLIRLLAGKLMEAGDRLNSAPVGPTLVADYFDLVPNCRDKLRVINRRLSQSPWFRALRNGHTFHYPGLPEWSDALAAGPFDALAIYIGDFTGNSLMYAADLLANSSMSRLVNATDPMAGLQALMDEVVGVAGLLGEFLQECAALYADRYLLRDGGRANLEPFAVPGLQEVHCSYFLGPSAPPPTNMNAATGLLDVA